MMSKEREKNIPGPDPEIIVELPEKRLGRYSWFLAICWTFFILGFLWLDIIHLREDTESLAIKDARAYFNKDQAFRYWAASHGGVYVPVTGKTPPNPLLKHVAERDITTPSGQKLTLMNPAYMVRQMNEYFRDLYGVAGHITSLNLHRQENMADEWERKALMAFERGEKEVLEFSEIDGKPYIRLMQPMITVEGCLKCHAYQGYKVGDVRGGVSVSVPLEDYYAHEREQMFADALTHIGIWLVGLLGIGWGYARLKGHLREREEAQEELRLSEKRLNRGQEVGQVGTWDWNPVTGGLIWSDEIYRIHGYEPGEIVPTYELFLKHLPQDDKEVLSKAVERALRDDEPYNIDCHIIKKDGSEIMANARGEVVLDENGKPVQMVGTFQDITARKEVEEKLREQLDELRRWNSLTLDREERVMELKEEVNALLKELGKEERYSKVK